MKNQIIAVLNLTYSVGIGIIGFNELEGTVKFCWINDGKQEAVKYSRLRTGSKGRPYFRTHDRRFYIDEFTRVNI